MGTPTKQDTLNQQHSKHHDDADIKDQLLTDSSWQMDNARVLVVYDPNAEALAQRFGVYLAPNHKSYRDSRYLAFYDNSRIETLYELTAPPMDNANTRNMKVLADLAKIGWADPKANYRVLTLRKLEDVGPIENDLVSEKTGKPYHYSYGQSRYTTLESIRQATVTSELADGAADVEKAPVDVRYIDSLIAQQLPVPEDEADRQQALHDYNVLDTAPEEGFDQLVKVASYITDSPIALVSLVDGKRQWFKAKQGIEPDETPREVSFCQHAIMNDEGLGVPDAQKDERFKNNPLVTGEPGMRSYYGAPLKTPEGHRIGTLCVIHDKPHELSGEQQAMLQALADEVIARLEVKRKNDELSLANMTLRATMAELEDTQTKLQELHSGLEDSINYAERIQRAILPSKHELEVGFKGAFVIYKPRDVVSGDFYFVHERRGKYVVAVGDCTGHGVPGAFMTLIGMHALKSIVKDRGILDPATILEELDYEVKQSLSTREDASEHDGMDISVGVIDPVKRSMQYANAKRKMYLTRERELVVLDGDRLSIGGNDPNEIQRFTTFNVEFEVGDHLYMQSDGIEDQLGGNLFRKYTPKRLHRLLKKIKPMDMQAQKTALETALNEWQGSWQQTDDQIMVGLKL